MRVNGTDDRARLRGRIATTPIRTGCSRRAICTRPPTARRRSSRAARSSPTTRRPSRAVPDLYRYDVAGGTLIDLTTADPDGAGVQGVIGASDNGNRVYFAASGALVPGARRRRGVNLYVRDGGTTRFITALDPSFSDDEQLDHGRIVQDRPRHPQRFHAAVQLARAAARLRQRRVPGVLRLRPGERLVPVHLLSPERRPGDRRRRHRAAADGRDLPQRPAAPTSAATCPQTARRRSSPRPERLVNSDTNGKYDAYMWKTGTSRLVSSGQSADDSAFVDASRQRQRRLLPDPPAAGRDRHRRFDRPLRRARRRRSGLPEPAPAPAAVPGRHLQAAGEPADRPAAQRHLVGQQPARAADSRLQRPRQEGRQGRRQGRQAPKEGRQGLGQAEEEAQEEAQEGQEAGQVRPASSRRVQPGLR